MRSSRWWVGYSVAALATAAVAAGRYAFDHEFGAAPHFLLPFVVPVLLAAWFGGGGPGLFATALNAVVVASFNGPGRGLDTGDMADRMRVGVLLGVGLFVSVVCENFRRYRQRVAATAAQVALRHQELQTEVTERRDAERRLLAGRSLLRLVTDHVPVLLVHCDRDMRYSFVNKTYAERFGLDADAVVGRTIPEVLGQPGYDRIKGHLAAALAGETVDFEADMPYPTTGLRRVHCTCRPAFASDGGVSGFVATIQDITERVRADDRLRESERRYRMLLEGVPQLVWTCRPDGWCDYLSRQWVEYTGVPEADQLGYGWSNAVHPDDRAALLERWQQSVRSGEPLDVEFRIRNGSGAYRWFRTRAVLFREADGESKWFGTNTDTDDKKRAEERLVELNADLERRVAERTAELRERAAFVRGVLDSLPAHIAVVDRAGTIVAVNRAWERFAAVNPGATGVGARTGVGVGYLAVCDGSAALGCADARAAAAAVRRVLADGEPWAGLEYDCHAPEQRRWFSMSVNPLPMAGGAVVSHTNITSRKHAEESLRESERRFRAIFHAQFQFIGLMSPDGILLEVNRGALSLVGASEKDVLGRPFWETPWWVHDPDQRDRVREAVSRAAGGEQVRFETHHPTADGRHIWVDFTLTAFRDDSGRIAFLIPEGRDITERKQAEAAVRASEQRLRLAAEAAGVGVWEWDVLTNRIHWNDQMFRIYQVAPTPDGFVPYETWSGAVLEEDLARQEGLLRDTVQRRGSGTRAFRIRWPDGQCRFIEAAEQVRATADGRAELVVGTNLDATARRQAEETVRDTEEQFRSAFDHAPIGMALVAPDGKWLRVNHSVCEMIGYTEAELLATDFQTITHPDDLDADLEFVGHLLAGTLPTYQLEKRYFHKRGQVVPVLLSVSLVRDGRGNPLHFISQIKDITQRKEAERALAAHDALLRQFIKHSPAAIAMFDRNVRYIQASDRWLTDYHLAGRDIIGLSHYEVFPDIPDHWKAIHKRVLAGAVDGNDEDPFQRADGSTEWLQWECRPWHTASGEVGGLIMFTQVITGRKRAEAALRSSEERFRVLFEQSSDAHLIFTEGGGIIDCNPAAVAMLRCPDKRAVLALHPAELSPDLQPDGRRSMEKCVEMDASARRNGHHRFDWLHRRMDGQDFPCEVTLTPVRLDGQSALLVVWHDLTERVRAEERVRASLREKDVLLKEIHHRVKNNLQIVSALLELQSGHTTDRAVVEMFRESQGRVKSMALIHERLYRSGDLAGVDFGEYVRQLADDLYRTYKVSDDDIRLELAVDIPPVPIDIAIPCGLLLNELVSNCLKHAFRDATGGCIRVSLARGGDGTVLSVSDDGAGFKAGVDFRNTTSFGLQLVNTLVEQLDGEVELTTSPGTTISVRFPKLKP